jgi:hypothetical protein
MLATNRITCCHDVGQENGLRIQPLLADGTGTTIDDYAAITTGCRFFSSVHATEPNRTSMTASAKPMAPPSGKPQVVSGGAEAEEEETRTGMGIG